MLMTMMVLMREMILQQLLAIKPLREVLVLMMVVATSAIAQIGCEVYGHDRGEVDVDVLDEEDVDWWLSFPFGTAVAGGAGGDMKIDAPMAVLHIDDADGERWLAVVDHDDKFDLSSSLTHFDYYQPHQVA